MKNIKNLFLNDKFILGLIIINSIIIFTQGFEINSLFNILFNVDNIITILFVIELIIKTKVFGLKKYLSSAWNVFDSILILIAIPSLYFWVFGGVSTHMEFLLILRVFRVFKFFRFLKFIPDIKGIVNGVQKALKSTVVIFMGFIVYNFIIAVMSCSLYKDISPEYFGNPMTSFYSTFKIFTVEGWYDIPDKISAKSNNFIGGLTKLYFIFIMVTGGIIGLSLVNSIFVDAMVSDNNDELLEKVKSLEDKIDRLLEKE